VVNPGELSTNLAQRDLRKDNYRMPDALGICSATLYVDQLLGQLLISWNFDVSGSTSSP